MANSPYTLFTLAAAGPSLTAGTAASMLITPAAGQTRPTIPANWIGYGTRITFDAAGILTTAASSPGTATWDLRLGSTVVASTQATATLPVSMASWKWAVHFDVTARSVGVTTSAQFWSQGWVTYAATASTDNFFQFPIGTNPPVLGTGFDSTVPNVLDSFFTESVATATLVCEQACAVIWNPNY